ncbi:MAG: cobalt transporter CbiM [Methanosarcinaceae archaeon]|nr:cobalt transporter CbiM [Methanosarcinaceae archaeon]
MHISDGVLSPTVIAVGWIITLTMIAITLRWGTKEVDIAEQIPKVSVMTAAFFVASLIHVSIGPTSVHLILNGLLGVVLGVFAYPAIFIGLVLQALLFQHGGITVIGVNTMTVGIPALIVVAIFKKGYSKNIDLALLGGICGGVAVIITTILLVVVLVTTGEEFTEVAYAVVAVHVPLMIIEGVITGSVVGFLAKVRPELLPIDTEVLKK